MSRVSTRWGAHSHEGQVTLHCGWGCAKKQPDGYWSEALPRAPELPGTSAGTPSVCKSVSERPSVAAASLHSLMSVIVP